MTSASLPARSPEPPTLEDPGLVLVVDDEPLLLRSLQRILRSDGHRIALAESARDAEATLADPALDVVLLDLLLGDSSGLDLLERLKRERPEVEVIVITGNASIESAVGCIRRGAFDYLAKPFLDTHRVRTTVCKALERRRLVRRNRELEAELRGRTSGNDLVGRSAGMRALSRTIQSLQHNQSTVLLEGESGTGKELVAHAIHDASRRADGPFVPVDCGALPETIIESELFGHEKGAFTGATGSAGLFRMAGGGTLFLDEIGEISLTVQAKLLRALQEKEVRPVGATRAQPVDIRVICATHRDLAEMVAEGRFRQDLFYRLNVVRIEIPPLRERREDIPLLARHFVAKHSGAHCGVEGIDEATLEILMQSDWPGNVRELENVIESAMALAPGPQLRPADLPRVRRLAVAGPRSTCRCHSTPTSAARSRARSRSAAATRPRPPSGSGSVAARCIGSWRSTSCRVGVAEAPARSIR